MVYNSWTIKTLAPCNYVLYITYWEYDKLNEYHLCNHCLSYHNRSDYQFVKEDLDKYFLNTYKKQKQL